MRVVSLVPSMTETLCEWGIEPVACTRFCEREDIEHVGGTKDPDLDAIARLEPDLVIVDREENRREDHDALVAAGVPVRVVQIRAPGDLAGQLGSLASELGVGWAMPHLPEAGPPSLSAFVPIWKRPWMALGAPTYGSELLSILGVSNVFGSDDDPYPSTTLEEAAARRPDVVLAPSEPYPFAERHRAELEQVAPVLFVNGKDLVWWGVRTPGAIRRLGRSLDEARIEILHAAALRRGESTYRDPATGYEVMTSAALEAQGRCCGSGCRHCPYPPREQASAGRPDV